MSTQDTDQPMPLKGVKVLEMGSLIAGPYASSLLAQFGAEVIQGRAAQGRRSPSQVAQAS